MHSEKTTCQRKQRYPSKESAKIAMRAAFEGETGLHVYPCRFCNGFHIGHASPMGRIDKLLRQIRTERRNRIANTERG